MPLNSFRSRGIAINKVNKILDSFRMEEIVLSKLINANCKLSKEGLISLQKKKNIQRQKFRYGGNVGMSRESSEDRQGWACHDHRDK